MLVQLAGKANIYEFGDKGMKHIYVNPTATKVSYVPLYISDT